MARKDKGEIVLSQETVLAIRRELGLRPKLRELEPWKDERVSRATWYRHRRKRKASRHG
jgi:hypothetical protein